MLEGETRVPEQKKLLLLLLSGTRGAYVNAAHVEVMKTEQ